MPRKRKTRDLDGLYRRGDSPYWWASLTDAGGQRTRRSTGTANRREAEALLAKWKLETFRVKQWGEQPARSFEELMVDYLRASDDKRSAHTDRIRTKRLWAHFAGRSIQEIAVSHVRAYIDARRAEGVGNATVNRELALFSAAINYANREWGWGLPNPLRGRKLREPEGRVRWITQEQASRLIQAAERQYRSPYLADLIRVALNTGCRAEELMGLEWSRVDLQARLISLEARHTKAAKRRSVPLNQTARTALLARRRFRAEHCPNSAWVFARKTGERVLSVKRSFATACQAAGIVDFRFHDLRHTCAAWLVSSGVALAEVRDLLGHASVTMTERYAHLHPENVRSAVGRLDAVQSRLSHVERGEARTTGRESISTR